MAYSNGYELSAVLAALENRLGFRQPLGSGVPTLSSAVTTTDSGRYFDDFHSLVTVLNIKASMEQAGASDANLITHLQNIRKAAILRTLNGVFTGQQVIDQVKLFKRYGQNDVLENNTGLFCGFEIDVADKPDAAMQLDALHLYFNEAATFNVYLFKDGDPTAVMTQSVTTVANKVTEIVLTGKVFGRGKYYLGYFQDDLGTAKGYREQVECFTDSILFAAEPMQADATGATTFDREQRSYTSQPIGLNAEISTFIDHTAQVKRKAAMFDELVGLTLAYSVIEQIVYTVRSNGSERILKEQLDKVGIQLDLTGAAPISESPQVMGLKQRIERELKTVKQSFYPTVKAKVVDIC